MQSELTLRITPQLDELTKAISKVTKSASIGLSDAIEKPMKKLKETYEIEKKVSSGLMIGPKLPSATLNQISNKLKEATKVKLDLDLSEANAKIDSMRYQVLGAFATFKGLVSKPISVAMDFETSMSDIKKVVSFESKAELKEFEKEIWNLTKTIPLAAKDLSAIVASGGQLGLEKNILIPFTDIVAKMSVAFDMGTAEAGDTIAGLMKKMGIGIDEVKELGDAINYLGAKSAGSPKEIVEILGRIGGMAKTLGMTKEQSAGLAGAFANMKIPSEQASTAINKMLSVLGNADGGTARFKKALNQIGLSGDEIQEMMKNPLQGIRDVLNAISFANDDEKIGILKDMFGEEAGPKIAQITSNMNEFDKILGLLSNKDNYLGSMQDEFDEVSKTTANALQLMNNSFAKLGNSIGSIFLPPLASASKAIADLVGGIADLLSKFPTLSASLVGIGGALMSIKIGAIFISSIKSLKTLFFYPLQLMMLSTRAITIKSTLANIVYARSFGLLTKTSNLVIKSIQKLGVVTSTFSKIFKVSMFSIKGALLSTGIGALIVGLGFLLEYLVSNWDSIAPKFVAIFVRVKQSISPVIEWFSRVFSFIGNIVDEILGSFGKIARALGIDFGGEEMREDRAFSAKQSFFRNGLIDSTVDTQSKNAQNFYNNASNRAINDNKTIYITTGANASQVVQAINANSYSYGD